VYVGAPKAAALFVGQKALAVACVDARSSPVLLRIGYRKVNRPNDTAAHAKARLCSAK